MNMTNCKIIHSASVGDIHLKHPNTPTLHILENLYKAFPDNEETGQLDILYIEGDLFDRLIFLNDDVVPDIERWVSSLLWMCSRRNIIVRVLEGTPSHDNRQSRMFVTAKEIEKIPVDMKYVTTLSIEYIESLGINVLYVPDEWRPETDQTWLEVCELLQQKGLQQVDYACMHGAFTYQLPEVARVPKHDMQRYLSIVKHYIFIGHIHIASRYERILAAGSFDRISHGEEEPKGHYRIRVDPKHGDTITFIENKGAKKYLTIDCTNLSLDDALIKLDIASKVPPNSAIRVEAHRSDPILVSLDVLRRKYPTISWSTKTEMGTGIQANLLQDHRQQYREIQINSTNIAQLVEEKMIAQGRPRELIDRSLALLPR